MSSKENINQNKKNITMKKLILSTNSIIQNEGIQNISIRKIAKESNLSSSIIYKYFDNLNHLIFFSCLEYLDCYINNLQSYVALTSDMIDYSVLSWKCFFHYSFMYPEIYYRIYFPDFDKDTSEYIKQYYELFPNKTSKVDEFIKTFIFKSSIYERNLIVLKTCAKLGLLSFDDIDDLSKMQIHIFYSLLSQVKNGDITPSEAEIEGVKFIVRTFNSFGKNIDSSKYI